MQEAEPVLNEVSGDQLQVDIGLPIAGWVPFATPPPPPYQINYRDRIYQGTSYPDYRNRGDRWSWNAARNGNSSSGTLPGGLFGDVWEVPDLAVEYRRPMVVIDPTGEPSLVPPDTGDYVRFQYTFANDFMMNPDPVTAEFSLNVLFHMEYDDWYKFFVHDNPVAEVTKFASDPQWQQPTEGSTLTITKSRPSVWATVGHGLVGIGLEVATELIPYPPAVAFLATAGYGWAMVAPQPVTEDFHRTFGEFQTAAQFTRSGDVRITPTDLAFWEDTPEGLQQANDRYGQCEWSVWNRVFYNDEYWVGDHYSQESGYSGQVYRRTRKDRSWSQELHFQLRDSRRVGSGITRVKKLS